jgi:hypothetical protein
MGSEDCPQANSNNRTALTTIQSRWRHDWKTGINIGLLLGMVMIFVEPAAAASQVSGLEIFSVIDRLHKALRNILFLGAPIVFLAGIGAWALTKQNSSWATAGQSFALKSMVAFGLALGIDVLFQAAAWVVTAV